MSAPVARKSRLPPGCRLRRLRRWLLPGVLLVLLGGCDTLGYYAHVANGQLKLLAGRQPVDRVLAELADRAAQDPEARMLRDRLLLSQTVLDFAERTLGLDVGGRYRSYVDLERDAVVWNLFAAPALSLEAHVWCYPLVGCLPYRGYFDLEKARHQRRALEARGLDTYLGAVAGYSTLGWFDDPLLSTFMGLEEAEFVELLLHELAHSRIWVRGDATFNESFASFVGREGARGWYSGAGRLPEFEAHRKRQEGRRRALRVLQEVRGALEGVYGSDLDPERKRSGKDRILRDAATCLAALARETGEPGYERLSGRLNNAYLASLATYSDGLPAFAALFRAAGGDWPRFFRRVEEIARLDEAARARALAGSGEDQVAAHGDDAGADEVECQALAGHGLDAEVAGAVHDHVGGGGHG